MTIKIHRDLIQGSDEWMACRIGLLTASEMKHAITPTLKIADNDKTRQHVYELLAQRINDYVEPTYVSDDMLRGHSDEILARADYDAHYGETQTCGFMTNDRWGFTIGYSPDALVGDDGLIECKSRRQKYQTETIVECGDGLSIPVDYVIQVQTGLLVSERKWCDFVSRCGGMPQITIRVLPDPKIQDAIVAAATAFEAKIAEKMARYHQVLSSKARLIPTERVIEQEMFA